MDFHMPEFPAGAIANFDAVEFVDQLERGKINKVALFAKCHFGNSFYDTKVGHKHAGLERDFLMETAQECRKRGIRALAYYSLCVDDRAWKENPAWRFQDRDGRTFGGNTFWAVTCMNTPYKDELVMPQLDEITRDYPVDGLWLDIPLSRTLTRCHCPCCGQKWQSELGLDPAETTSEELDARLAMRTWEDYLLEVRAMIERNNPELVIATNRAGTPNASLRVKNLVEIGTWESQPRPGNYLGHSFAARTARNDVLDVEVMSVRFYSGWGDLSMKPAAQMTTEFAAMIGNGMAAVSGDQVNVDGTLQAPVYDMFNESFGFVHEHEAALKDAESVRHAVILLPCDDPELTMDFGCTMDSWHGAHKMLVESHVQTDLIYSILADDLSRYPVIVLPEPARYAAETHDALREYVRQGGTLVAVGNALVHDSRFELEDVFGLQYIEPLSFSNCHFVPSAQVCRCLPEIPHQIRGQAYKVRATGASELAALHYPMAQNQGGIKEFRSPFSPASYARSPFSFALLNEFGAGKAVYIAASVFEIYWKTNHHWLRQFMENVLRHVDRSMPYDIDASALIEANLMKEGGDLLLNLIHYSLGHQGGQSAIAAIERVDSVHDILCKVRCGKPGSVRLEPSGEDVPFEMVDGHCWFTVPETKYMSVVRLVGCAG